MLMRCEFKSLSGDALSPLFSAALYKNNLYRQGLNTTDDLYTHVGKWGETGLIHVGGVNVLLSNNNIYIRFPLLFV